MKKTLQVLSLAIAATFAPAAWGAIVYVDAVPNTTGADGNTTVDGALVNFGTNATNLNTTSSGVGTDGFWNYRPGTEAAGGSYWETDTDNSAGESTLPLVTSVNLGPGTYNLFGLFRPQASTHDAAFSINGVDYSNFAMGNSLAAALDGSDFVNPGDVGDIDAGIGDLYIASLGQITLPAAATVSIYAQGPDLNLGGNNNGQRTRFEGIGYEVVPEPSSMLLITIGLLGIAMLRRKPC